MLHIHITNLENDNIYRTLALRHDQTLRDVELIIVAAFQLYEFEADIEIITKNGENQNKILRLSIYEEIGDQLLTDWLMKAGDTILFVSDSFEAQVTLQAITNETLPINICLDAAGSLLDETAHIDTAEVEEAMMVMDLIHNYDENMLIDYGGLLALSQQLNKQKPWEYFENDEIIAITLEELDATFYVSIMGASQQQYGLMIYDEEYGYPALLQILSGQPLDFDFHHGLEALTINFVDRNELEKHDYQLIKEHGFSFRGKNNWVQFRHYDLGVLPYLPTYADVEIMKAVIQAILHVTTLASEGHPLPVSLPRYHHMHATMSLESGHMTDDISIVEVKPAPAKIEIQFDDIIQKRIKRLPKANLQLEFDLFYMPHLTPSPDDEEEELLYPVLCIALDRATGESVFFELLPFPKVIQLEQEMLLAFLLDLGVRPSKLFVRKTLHDHLLPLAKQLGLNLVVSEIPAVRSLYEHMKHSPPTHL